MATICYCGLNGNAFSLDTSTNAGFNYGGTLAFAPILFGNTIYYVDSNDNFIYQVVVGETAATKFAASIGGCQTGCQIFVACNYLWFVGLDGGLYQAAISGTEPLVNFLGIQTTQSPIQTNGYVYYIGENGFLWSAPLGGGTPMQYPIAPAKGVAFAVMNNSIYYKGGNGSLYSYPVGAQNAQPFDFNGFQTSSAPCITASNVFCVGNDGFVYQLDFNGAVTPLNVTSPCTPAADSSNCYFTGDNQFIYSIPVGGGAAQSLNVQTAGTPFCDYNNQPQSGSLTPKYSVLTVIYAPPGSTASSTPSSVTYGTESSISTTTSTTCEFGSSASVSASADLEGSGADADSTISVSNASTNSVEVSVSTSQAVTVSATSTEDGIDHNNDQFYIWVNPTVTVVYDPYGNTVWGPTVVAGQPIVSYYLTLGAINTPDVMTSTDPTVQMLISQYGFVQTDFEQICALNPFSTNPPTATTARFTFITSFPFEPASPGDSNLVGQEITLESSTTTTNTTEQSTSLEVGITASAGLEGVGISTSASWEWTYTTEQSSSSGTTQTASAYVVGPGSTYTGPEEIYVYIDSVYQTFMFSSTQLT